MGESQDDTIKALIGQHANGSNLREVLVRAYTAGRSSVPALPSVIARVDYDTPVRDRDGRVLVTLANGVSISIPIESPYASTRANYGRF